MTQKAQHIITGKTACSTTVLLYVCTTWTCMYTNYTLHTNSARLPGETSPYERAVTNIMASQDGHLYAQLEAEDACRAGVSYYREQHVYEDAEKYFK